MHLPKWLQSTRTAGPKTHGPVALPENSLKVPTRPSSSDKQQTLERHPNYPPTNERNMASKRNADEPTDQDFNVRPGLGPVELDRDSVIGNPSVTPGASTEAPSETPKTTSDRVNTESPASFATSSPTKFGPNLDIKGLAQFRDAKHADTVVELWMKQSKRLHRRWKAHRYPLLRSGLLARVFKKKVAPVSLHCPGAALNTC